MLFSIILLNYLFYFIDLKYLINTYLIIKHMSKKLGIIQTRGLGDIFISLPIAHYYYKEGWSIYWPIQEEWVEEMTALSPWVKWIPVTRDHGPFFYDIPLQRLTNFKCDEILVLYNALTNHPEFSKELFFQQTSFDRYKYFKAGVPFLNKWKLSECITRDHAREQALYEKLVKNPNYVVIHTTASEHTANFDRSIIPEEWDQIKITNTGRVTDWLTIIDRAQSIILTNSVFANITDQLGLGTDRYFLPISHIQLTPVLGHDWTWLENLNMDPRAKIFAAGNT